MMLSNLTFEGVTFHFGNRVNLKELEPLAKVVTGTGKYGSVEIP